jgi:dTDP-4-dehydrorhamnose 3,5-epimerase-like enzyme
VNHVPNASSSGCRIVELPKIPDARGNLTFAEGHRHIPFAVKRAYWLYDVPGGQMRGGHAYHQLAEFVISLSGSFDVVVDAGSGPQHFVLNRSYFGLYIPSMIWRHIENFSTNAVALILASRHYEEDDYIRDYDEFVRRARGAG